MGVILLLYLGQYFCFSAFAVIHSVWLFLDHQAAVQIGQDFVSHEMMLGQPVWIVLDYGALWWEELGWASIWIQAFVVIENGFRSQAGRRVMQERLEMLFPSLLRNPMLFSLWHTMLVSTFAPSQGLDPLVTGNTSANLFFSATC